MSALPDDPNFNKSISFGGGAVATTGVVAAEYPIVEEEAGPPTLEPDYGVALVQCGLGLGSDVDSRPTGAAATGHSRL